MSETSGWIEMMLQVYGWIMVMAFMVVMALYGVGVAIDRHNMISECEDNLPRNQHCILKAVPSE